MINSILEKSKKVFGSAQASIFSAASIIMVMVLASKILGFVRQRILFDFFSPGETDLFFAAFEMPDLIFEVFVYGVLSASFIPVFSRFWDKNKKDAWKMAGLSLNLVFLVFALFAALLFLFAHPLYTLILGGSGKSLLDLGGGFTPDKIEIVVLLSRILLVAQMFFVLGSFFTGVLESFRRFLITGIAPLFYNLGIILGTYFLSDTFGLLGPVLGAVIGAFGHFAIQLPFTYNLGFRFTKSLNFKHPGVKQLARLSAPRVLELSLFQFRRLSWLYLSSLVIGGITYLKSADLLQTLPVGIFGLSLAKAAFPNLSHESGKNMKKFNATYVTTLNQILFFVIPSSIFLIVLRVPIVRLVFGSSQFDWNATTQTGLVLTAFGFGIFAYACSLLSSRAYYALHDTKTPLYMSAISVFLNVVLGIWFVAGLGFGIWGIALAYSVAAIVQFLLMNILLAKKIRFDYPRVISSFTKILLSASLAAFVMYFILKIFDQSVWVKRLSFIGYYESLHNLPFQKFVLDTRYTSNLLVLTIMVLVVGVIVFMMMAHVLRTEELYKTIGFVKKYVISRRSKGLPEDETEFVSPQLTDGSSQS